MDKHTYIIFDADIGERNRHANAYCSTEYDTHGNSIGYRYTDEYGRRHIYYYTDRDSNGERDDTGGRGSRDDSL